MGIAIGGIIVGQKYIDILIDMRPVYFAAAAITIVAFLIFIFNRTKRYIQMTLSYIGVSIVLVAALFFARPYIEPWVSCKDISDVFKQMDNSQTPVLASKFYVRGIRYYTDRPMAVIDINGKGFWSPHPIPFLNTDQMVIDFLNKRPVTWAILKKGNVEDLRRILQDRNFKIHELEGIGGKFILQIEKIS